MSLRRIEHVLSSTVQRSLFSPAGQGGAGAKSQGSSLLTYLKAYYAFETLTTDSSGNGNTLTNVNSVTQAAGLIGQAASLASASSQCFSRAETPSIAIAGVDWILAGWVNFATVGTSVLVASKMTSNATFATIEFKLFKQATDKFLFQTSDGTVSHNATETLAVSASTWTFFQLGFHVAATSTLYLKMNNRTTLTATQTSGIPSTGGAWLLGAQNPSSPNSFMNGLIDEWGLWKPPDTSAVFETYAASLWNGGAGTTPPFTGIP